MSGTTLCPHCNTRFRIAEAQLEAHQGMVRCGSCLQAFDARPNFVPDQPDLQPQQPVAEESAALPEAPAPTEAQTPDEAVASDAALPAALETVAEAAAKVEIPAAANEDAAPEQHPEQHPDHPHHDSLDFSQPVAVPPSPPEAQPVAPRAAESLVLQPKTLAEQVQIVQDDDTVATSGKRRTWLWATGCAVLLLVMCAQAAYFFRIDLAAKMPGLKPALEGYCRMLNCTVPLPQKTELMSIESSDLEANPNHENLITLNALLRNRAAYAQAFPNLELTLNDSQDKPLARRIFKPSNYLPPVENEATGLLPNHELNIKIPLDTTDLKPSGYRLVLFYPQ
ncbi:MAG TPA: DUF3426 domain-containing protein [Gallionella sp.]|nr:DUF3426 domain-containing protein [Gallionella sp.]